LGRNATADATQLFWGGRFSLAGCSSSEFCSTQPRAEDGQADGVAYGTVPLNVAKGVDEAGGLGAGVEAVLTVETRRERPRAVHLAHDDESHRVVAPGRCDCEPHEADKASKVTDGEEPSSPPRNILDGSSSLNHTLREIKPEAGNGVHYPIGIPTGVCTPSAVRIGARDRDDDNFSSASLGPHPVATGYYVDDRRTSSVAMSREE